MYKLASVTFALVPLFTVAARADVPVLDDEVLDALCSAAVSSEPSCENCSCTMRTSTTPVSGLDERTSGLLIGLVLDVAGKRDDGSEFSAAHIALGTTKEMTRVGRLATSRQDGDKFTQYDILALPAVMDMCPGMCDWEAVGVIHPLEVTTTETVTKVLEDATHEETVREETRLVLCFQGPGGISCGSTPLKLEERVVRPAMAPGMKTKVLSKAGYARTWKWGKLGDIAFGKVTGKLASRLSDASARKVKIMDIFPEPDGRNLER